MKSEKNAINSVKIQRSCVFTNIFVGIFVKAASNASVTNSNVLAFMSKRYKQCSNALFVKALQTLQTLHIFESQARVRI